MKHLGSIIDDVDLAGDFVEAAFMACADLEDNDRRPALRSLIYHVQVMLQDIETALVALNER